MPKNKCYCQAVVDNKLAYRYLKTMIYLIGGSSHAGKTLVARNLSKKLGYDVLSLDKFKDNLIASGKTTITDDMEMRYFMWPLIADIIKNAITTGKNMIVEGCYIPREWKQSFTKEELKQIKSLFIVMSENYIKSHLKDIEKFAEAAEKRANDVIDEERLIRCSKNFKEDCSINKTGCFEIDRAFDLNQLEALFLEEKTH